MTEGRVRTIYGALERSYGRKRPMSADTGLSLRLLEELVLSLLKLPDQRSQEVLARLRGDFVDWNEIRVATPDELSRRLSRDGEAYNTARRIQDCLQEIMKERGNLDLSFLQKSPLPKARAFLKRLESLKKPEVAVSSEALLAALGHPVMPVDQDVLRVARRLRLASRKASMSEVQRALRQALGAGQLYSAYRLLREHAYRFCWETDPDCRHCVLRGRCPSFNKARA